jgi:5-formyltetrahydrofolate cyclo-ligase
MKVHQSETNGGNTLQKKALREALLRARGALTDQQRHAATVAIADGVLAWCERWQPASLGVYWPIRGEPDLRTLYDILARRGIALALPVADNDEQPLRFLKWTPGDITSLDRFGAATPLQRQVIAPAALLIPCVGFTLQRIRLGYGGGFYDRTLAQLPRPATLGVAYDCGETAFIGGEHDIALDTILTESRRLGPPGPA